MKTMANGIDKFPLIFETTRGRVRLNVLDVQEMLDNFETVKDIQTDAALIVYDSNSDRAFSNVACWGTV